MPLESTGFNEPEHFSKIDIARTGFHVDFVFAVIFGDSHSFAETHVHSLDKPFDSDRIKMGMVDDERPP